MFHSLQNLKCYNLPTLWISKNNLKDFDFNLIPFITHTYSILYSDDNYIYKFCKIQRLPKDTIRKIIFNSQAMREFNGAKILNSMGIKTPLPIAHATTVFPFESIESLYIMEYIKDSTPLSDRILGNKNLLELLIKDLLKMKKENLLFKDLRFHNILVKNNQLIWIDTDVKYLKKNYNEKLRTAIVRLTENHITLKVKILKRLDL